MRRLFSSRVLLRVLLHAFVLFAILAGGLVLSGARALAAGGEPTISSVSATNVSEHGATLEAQIDPNGLETAYEFWVEFANCQPGPCDSISVNSVGHGYISAGSASQTVSVVLSNLQPHYSYTYWVFAANSAGWAKGSGKEFEAVNTGAVRQGGARFPQLKTQPRHSKGRSNRGSAKRPRKERHVNSPGPNKNGKPKNARPRKSRKPRNAR